jgi:hypothetical protein
MKAWIKPVITFSLVFAIIFSGTGVVMAVHTCLSGAFKEVSLFKSHHCCDDQNSCNKSAQKNIEKQCCEFNVSYHKLTINGFQDNQVKISPAIFSGYHTPFIFSLRTIKNARIPSIVFRFTDQFILLNKLQI